MNTQIIISADTLLTFALLEADNRALSQLPTLEQLNQLHSSSNVFRSKMTRIRKKVRHQQLGLSFLRATKKVALSLACFLAIITCMFAPVDAVQEAVTSTVIEWNNQFVKLMFHSDHINSLPSLNRLTINYLPEGYSHLDVSEIQNSSFYQEYKTISGLQISIYATLIENNVMSSFDNEYATQYQLTFDNINAIWTITNAGKNVLVYPQDSIIFQISGNIPIDEIIKIAQNIKIS